MAVLAFFCLTMDHPTIAQDKKEEKRKEPTGEKFNDKDLTKENFKNRTFKDNTTFEDSDCRGINFNGGKAKDAIFKGADLTKTDMEKGDWTGADFRKAKMDQTWLRYAVMADANLEGQDLSKSHLRETNLRGANLRNLKAIGEVMDTNFDRADLRGANLSQMTFHDPKKFNKAKYDKDTRWPAKLDPVAAGAILVTEENKN
jgi:uncharacterized protein YjbI with pentapeptide repeats